MQPLVINNRLESNDSDFVDTPGDFKARKALKFMHLNVLSLFPERDYIKSGLTMRIQIFVFDQKHGFLRKWWILRFYY
jgi:hypothetical protein